MKKAFLILTGIAVLALSFIPDEKGTPSLELGSTAPLADREMNNASGEDVSLKSVMGNNGLLVIFSCNTCPFVIGKEGSEGWQGRYNEIFELAGNNEIGGILINSNEAKRDKGDSFQDMVQQSRNNRYRVAYALDEDHIMADAFGAKTTPHVFLFDGDYKLVYKGAIDDNNNSVSQVNEPWLKNALNNLVNFKKIEPNTTKAIGCSIKRVSK
jgi:hypothetical protein